MKKVFLNLIGGVLLFCGVFVAPSAVAATQVGSAPYKLSVAGAGNSYAPVFSADGKHVAFVSHANNLVANDDLGPHLDLFVRDLVASNTVLVSVSTNGFGGANDNIGLYTMSPDVQVVAFETLASNLAPGDTNRWRDIYVRDLVSGVTRLITSGANGHSSNPLISENGQRVIFESLASNLVTNDFNGTNDIFIHDLTTGVTELVSVNSSETASASGVSHSPSISADGLRIAFASRAKDIVLLTLQPFEFGAEIFVRDIGAGITYWAGAASSYWAHDGRVRSGAYDASEPVMSRDGRYVAFKTLGLVARFDLLLPRNSIELSYTNSTPEGTRVDSFRFADNPRPAASSSSTPLAVTPDGRYLALNLSSNIVPSSGIGLVDFRALVTNVIEIPAGGGTAGSISSFSTNVESSLRIVLTNAGPASALTWTRMPWLSLSLDGSRISFLTDATNLVDGVTNRVTHLYSLEVESGAVGLVSSNATGRAGDDLNFVAPSASPDGSLVGWDSPDSEMVNGDLNRAWDVFVRDVGTGETQLISARHPDSPAASGLALSRLDLNPRAISANGQRLAILSLDNMLVPDDTNRWRDLIVRDFATGTNIDVSRSSPEVGISSQASFPGTNAATAPFLSADGRQIAFAAETMQLGQTSPYGTNTIIYQRDLASPSNKVVVSGGPFSRPVLSPDGRFVAFHSASSYESDYYLDGNNQNDVYVFGSRIVSVSGSIIDCPLDPSVLPSRFASSAWNQNRTANGPSINPAFTPDSSWLFFESLATDLLENPVSPTSRYQLYARSFIISNRPALGCIGRVDVLDYSPTRLISYAIADSTDPALAGTEVPLLGGGANPRFSADARYVAFESGTNLIYRHDLRGEWKATVGEIERVAFTNYARAENLLVCSNCANASLNLDGRYLAYESRPALGGVTNIYIRDLTDGSVEVVSRSLSGATGNGSSFSPALSQDARFVVFASRASDLVPGDGNRATDIFVRDRWAGLTHCLSRNLAGTGTGNRVSSNPILSADGRTVAFQSFASDLVARDYNDTRDVFVVTLGGPDNDGDGMEDDWEVAYFNTLARDGSGDFDNDGSNDRDEFRAGTSPANDASILRVLRLTTGVAEGNAAARTTVILWQAIPGRTYRVETKEDIRMPWVAVGVNVVATGVAASVTHEQDVDWVDNRRNSFYRVVLVQ